MKIKTIIIMGMMQMLIILSACNNDISNTTGIEPIGKNPMQNGEPSLHQDTAESSPHYQENNAQN
ncbi:MAG: hypothetical protein WC846_04325 [Candidatus Gracilibacteria bacterium]